MNYVQPTSLPAALEQLQRHDTAIVAGGTDHYPSLAGGHDGRPVLDVTRIEGLRGVAHVDQEWRIGAATTWTDLARAELPPTFAGLQSAAREVGGPQIQNAGTVAGNLCNASPAADGVPPLLTLDASVELRSVGSTRRLPLADFIVGPRRTVRQSDELVTALLIPDHDPRSVGSFEKLGSRSYLVISIVMVAAMAVIDETGRIDAVRLSVGACSPVARRLRDVEAALVGRSIDQPLADAVSAESLLTLSPIDDVRASAAYRQSVVPELIERAVRGCHRASGTAAVAV